MERIFTNKFRNSPENQLFLVIHSWFLRFPPARQLKQEASLTLHLSLLIVRLELCARSWKPFGVSELKRSRLILCVKDFGFYLFRKLSMKLTWKLFPYHPGQEGVFLSLIDTTFSFFFLSLNIFSFVLFFLR